VKDELIIDNLHLLQSIGANQVYASHLSTDSLPCVARLACLPGHPAISTWSQATVRLIYHLSWV